MILLLIGLPYYLFNPNTAELSISEIRTLYIRSSSDEDTCEQLITMLEPFNETNNCLLAGYRACATMMLANYKINPLVKYSNFKAGKKLLEQCINVNPNNIELRFLRLAAQCNTPGFLKYNKSIESDKNFLIDSINALNDFQLKELITTFLSNSELLSQIEKQNLLK